ncbi:MAG: hypothetical protein ACYS9X_11090 [Planctomycetota bacterium]|jgi:hypothetical protein
MKRPTPREITFIVTGLAGAAVIFLPFVYGHSPIGVAAKAWPEDWALLVLASVPFLAIPILASTARQALFGPLTRWEVRAAYALAFAALAATAFVMLYLITEHGGNTEDAVLPPSALILAVGAAVVLAATRKGHVPPATHAHIAMLVAWMPNAAFCLTAFGDLGVWGSGFYLACVTLIAYAVEAGVRVRRALGRKGEGEAEAPPS